MPSNMKGVERSRRFPSKFFNRIPKEQEPHERTMTESMQKMETLQGYCSDLCSGLNNYFDKFREFHEAKEELSRCFLQCYQETKELMKSVAVAYSKEVEVSKNKKLPRWKSKIENVLKELEDYRFKMSVSKDSIEERKKLLSSFNYYTMKCDGLKAKQDKWKESGKLETSKSKEKIERNHEKLQDVKSAFFKEHQVINDEFNRRWVSRFTFLNSFMDKVLNNEFMFFESYCKGLQKTKQILLKTVEKSKNPSCVRDHGMDNNTQDWSENFGDSQSSSTSRTEDISPSRKKLTLSCKKTQKINNNE